MMKRLCILLAALLLLCSMSALAEENVYQLIENALYRIVLRTETGDETLGSGLLFTDQHSLLTSVACLADGPLYAIGADGEHPISSAEKVGQSGAALLEMAAPSTATPLHLAAEDAAGMAALFGVGKDGAFTVAPLNQVRATIFLEQDALLLSAAEGLLPGSFLTDEHGGLIGLCIAQHAEGQGAYIALESNGLFRALTRQLYAEVYLPVESSWQNGELTIAWTDEERDGGFYRVTISSDDNQYYNFLDADHDVRSLSLAVPPEHRYDFHVQWVADYDSTSEPVWAAMSEAFIPGGAFSRFGFAQTCSIATRTETDGPADLAEQVDMRLMTDPSLYKFLRVTATYDVQEEIELPMTIELLAPDGQFYFESATHVFSPAKEKEDAFLLPLDSLLADCAAFAGGTLEEGMYRLRYAIAGETAGEYAFTLEKAPGMNGETFGYITDVAAQYSHGAVTLSWPAQKVPADASVRVFHMYDGNSYYSYQLLERGQTQTEIYTLPGRATHIWLTWLRDPYLEPDMPADSAHLITLPAVPEEPFTLHGFENQRLGLTIADDPGAAEGTAFLPEVKLTRELLTDWEKVLIFQTEDTYQVAEMSEEHPMMLALCTPEGLCFTAPLLYSFDPALQESDLWLIDVTSLCRDYESLICGAWPAGHYRFLYCIDGQVAGEYHFTLE